MPEAICAWNWGNNAFLFFRASTCMFVVFVDIDIDTEMSNLLTINQLRSSVTRHAIGPFPV